MTFCKYNEIKKNMTYLKINIEDKSITKIITNDKKKNTCKYSILIVESN